MSTSSCISTSSICRAACRIQNDDVVAVVLGVCQRLLGDLRRLCTRQGEHGGTRLLAHHLQLIDGRRAVDIAGHQHGAAALFDKVFCQLLRMGGFTIALQAASMRMVWPFLMMSLGASSPPIRATSSSLTILTTCWAGVRLLHDLLAHGALRDLGRRSLRQPCS